MRVCVCLSGQNVECADALALIAPIEAETVDRIRRGSGAGVVESRLLPASITHH